VKFFVYQLIGFIVNINVCVSFNAGCHVCGASDHKRQNCPKYGSRKQFEKPQKPVKRYLCILNLHSNLFNKLITQRCVLKLVWFNKTWCCYHWQIYFAKCMNMMTFIQPASKWMHWATLWCHSDLSWAATSASSSVIPIFDKSLLMVLLQFARGRPGPLLNPGTSQCNACRGIRWWSIRITCPSQRSLLWLSMSSML